jgi:hypothetical protein
MPILVRTRQARRLQGENRPDQPHCHIANQRLEVFAIGRARTRLTKIVVEDTDLLRPPAKGLGLSGQIVLAIRAFLIEAHLPHR